MLWHGSQAGAFDLRTVVLESIESMRRAGGRFNNNVVLHQRRSATASVSCSIGILISGPQCNGRHLSKRSKPTYSIVRTRVPLFPVLCLRFM